MNSAPLVIPDLEDLLRRNGELLGTTDWFMMSQDDVDAFADVSRDHQWIHVDRERAASSPFGGTIAHGFYTLSLLTHLHTQLFDVRGITHGVNYGLDRVRFPAPSPVGSAVRLTVTLAAVERRADRSMQARYHNVFESTAGDKPVCIADFLIRYFD